MFIDAFYVVDKSAHLAVIDRAAHNRDITISTLGMFGNPLEDQPLDRDTLQGWKDCIDNAHHFGALLLFTYVVLAYTKVLVGQRHNLAYCLMNQIVATMSTPTTIYNC